MGQTFGFTTVHFIFQFQFIIEKTFPRTYLLTKVGDNNHLNNDFSIGYKAEG